jgi:predicted nucleic acid-binding protein
LKKFFDSTVLVAAAIVNHERHEPSLMAFSQAHPTSAVCAAHNLAEVYATLTRYPGKGRLSPEQALLALDEIELRLAIVTLDVGEYRAAIRSFAGEGIIGATVYDGIIAACAIKARAEVLYTWNTQHFLRLGPAVSRLVRTPELR